MQYLVMIRQDSWKDSCQERLANLDYRSNYYLIMIRQDYCQECLANLEYRSNYFNAISCHDQARFMKRFLPRMSG